jgi:hypothetical protein
VTPAEARALIELGDGPAQPELVRRAYVRRAPAVRIDLDPGGFMRLRTAYELLTRGSGVPSSEVMATRAELFANPDSVDLRWRLLSYFPYGKGTEAFSILCEGAERRPDPFLDELLFHFPERVPAGILEAAHEAGGFGRLLLLADVHAVQGHPAKALESFRSAMTAADLHSSATMTLAARPIFSLHAHAQIDAANEALTLLKQRAGEMAMDARVMDWKTQTIFKIADELRHLGSWFPLGLRQVAAGAAKNADFDNAPYEARFATGSLKPREVRRLSEQLNRESPALAKLLSLGLALNPADPIGRSDFRIRISWGAKILVAIGLLRLIFVLYRMARDPLADQKRLVKSIAAQLASDQAREIREACAHPDAERCRYLRALFSNQTSNPDSGTGVSATGPDGEPGIGTVGALPTSQPSPPQ